MELTTYDLCRLLAMISYVSTNVKQFNSAWTDWDELYDKVMALLEEKDN